ncbi:MAG: histidine kinase dimerization/phosphoacceptor domain -containing protein [Gallionellaceae bacterium]|nr:histidine kinase dimerization/phosphoacceptor domain -containing protein [Gallionellaceae bacterium]
MSQLFRYPLFQWAFTATACLLSGLLAYALVGSAMAPALFWPPAGVAVAAVVLWGWRVIPAAALGTALAAAFQETRAMPALWLGLAIAVQATLSWFLLRWAGVTKSFNQIGDLFRLVLSGGLLGGLAALPLAYLALREVNGFWELDLAWQASALLLSQLDGVLVFAPLMLCWRNTDNTGLFTPRVETGVALLGLGLGSLLLANPELFGLPAASLRPYPLMPFLLWLALRAEVRVVALALAWIYAVLAANANWGHWAMAMSSDPQWVRPLHGFITVIGMSFLALGMLTSTNRRLERAHLEDVLAQRDALIREVHHRIKNNLQTVVGLLRRDAAKHPEAAPMLESAINQVQSIAVVHGLHGGVNQHGVMLCELLPAICRGISDIGGVPVRVKGIAKGGGSPRLQESETVAMALILNELVSNAVKHLKPESEQAGVSVTLSQEVAVGRVRISNPGRLPSGFDFARNKGLGTGLGLVLALLPTHGVSLDLRQEGGDVVTEMRIEPPILAPRTEQKVEA